MLSAVVGQRQQQQQPTVLENTTSPTSSHLPSSQYIPSSHEQLTPGSADLSHSNYCPPPPQNVSCNLPSPTVNLTSQSSQVSNPFHYNSHSSTPLPQNFNMPTQSSQTTSRNVSQSIQPLHHQHQELPAPSSKQAPSKTSQPCFESTEVLELLSSINPDSFSEDSDYLTYDSSYDVLEFSTAKSKGSRSEKISSVSSSREPSSSRSVSVSSPAPQPQVNSMIPPPPFKTPPKLQSVEQVMNNYTGTDVASLRILATALAKEAIFGREEMSKASLSGRKGTGTLSQEKLDYIKTLVKSRVSHKPAVEFEHIWSLCRSSLSKSCQALRHAKRKL